MLLEMKKPKIDLTTQNKLIITGLLISTVLIVAVAIFAISNIQQKLYDSYGRFGQLLTKTLAIQSYELTKDAPIEYKQNLLKTHANLILTSNKDISFITFKDSNGKIIYTTTDAYNKRAQYTKINVNSPMTNDIGKVVGSVEIGLSADLASVVAKTTKNSMLVVFTLVWVIFTIVMLINTFLITRELTLLHHGVREITSGKFGTVIDYKQSSGEIRELFNAFNDMSKRLHSYEEQNVDKLTTERNKLEAVLMSIANGVVVCDNFDKVSLINPAAQKILSVAPMDIVQTPIQNYCDTNGELCFKDKILTFKNTPLEFMENKALEFNVNVDDRVVKSLISPMYSNSRDYLGYIIILIDITKEAEVDKLKNDFISNVSHELRTPVTILTSYAETLYHYGDQFKFEEQKEFIGTINQEVIRLNKMVSDILDFSKLQNNDKLEKFQQNIMPLIERSIEDHKILANEKQITFSVIKEPDLPEVMYNEQSIERVLSNLITNAIKYSKPDSRIKVRAEIAKDPNFIEVSIEDNGIGIAPQHQTKIFDRFYRIENDAHTIKGTGLGLHLVKIAIEKHHKGKVFVQSKVNEGSTFSFWLPACSQKLQQETPEKNENSAFENSKTIAQKLNEMEIDNIVEQDEIETSIKDVIGAEQVEQVEQIEIEENTHKSMPSMTIAQLEQKENIYEPVEINTISDIEKKTVQDAIAVGEEVQDVQNSNDDEWEITFEVRDKN